MSSAQDLSFVQYDSKDYWFCHAAAQLSQNIYLILVNCLCLLHCRMCVRCAEQGRRTSTVNSCDLPLRVSGNMSLVMRKPDFCICENKTQISFAVTAKLISAFVFAARKVQSLFFLTTNFQASSHLLWLYSPVCVGPGRKPRRPVFSQRGSY